MLILNFSSSQPTAFSHAFVKGLAAPYLLFGAFSAPDVAPPVQVIPQHLNTDPLLHDCGMVSADWIKACNTLLNHGQTATR